MHIALFIHTTSRFVQYILSVFRQLLFEIGRRASVNRHFASLSLRQSESPIANCPTMVDPTADTASFDVVEAQKCFENEVELAAPEEPQRKKRIRTTTASIACENCRSKVHLLFFFPFSCSFSQLLSFPA
jgi:hypothetical protein